MKHLAFAPVSYSLMLADFSIQKVDCDLLKLSELVRGNFIGTIFVV